jgi:hypothetical protein
MTDCLVLFAREWSLGDLHQGNPVHVFETQADAEAGKKQYLAEHHWMIAFIRQVPFTPANDRLNNGG